MTMKSTNASSPSVASPFLARFAIPRSKGQSLPGGYDPSAGMWLTEFGGELRPIIEAQADLAEITTKTKVENEEDDTRSCLLEITTKTEANTEKDDQKALAGASLELTTKTSAQMESDDTKPEGFGFW